MADEPDGLESLGFDPTQQAMKPRGPWWLATRSLRSSIVLVSVWAAFFLLRLIELFIGASVDWLGGILLAVSGFLVIGYLPSLVHFARLRNSERATNEG